KGPARLHARCQASFVWPTWSVPAPALDEIGSAPFSPTSVRRAIYRARDGERLPVGSGCGMRVVSPGERSSECSISPERVIPVKVGMDWGNDLRTPRQRGK